MGLWFFMYDMFKIVCIFLFCFFSLGVVLALLPVDCAQNVATLSMSRREPDLCTLYSWFSALSHVV